MYQEHVKTLKKTIHSAADIKGSSALAKSVFAYFFERYPEAAKYFESNDPDKVYHTKFWRVSECLIDALDAQDYAENLIEEELYRHKHAHDVSDMEYYFALFDALHHATQETLQESWDSTIETHWKEALSHVKSLFAKMETA